MDDKQLQRTRIEDFLSRISAFPSQSREGRRQDERYREILLSDLAALGVSLNALSNISRSVNSLSMLLDTVKRP